MQRLKGLHQFFLFFTTGAHRHERLTITEPSTVTFTPSATSLLQLVTYSTIFCVTSFLRDPSTIDRRPQPFFVFTETESALICCNKFTKHRHNPASCFLAKFSTSDGPTTLTALGALTAERSKHHRLVSSYCWHQTKNTYYPATVSYSGPTMIWRPFTRRPWGKQQGYASTFRNHAQIETRKDDDCWHKLHNNHRKKELRQNNTRQETGSENDVCLTFGSRFCYFPANFMSSTCHPHTKIRIILFKMNKETFPIGNFLPSMFQ